jgi:hypothetical protein
LIPLLCVVGIALGEVQRFAIVVANNDGAVGDDALIFAEQDAKKMHGVLTELGGVSLMNTRSLYGKGRGDLIRAMADIQGPIASGRQNGNEAVLYFYYSGHADADALHLGRSTVTWDELATMLSRSGADVRVAFVDACQSGALTRRKGGARAPGFVLELEERLDARGSVIVTSSAVDEASQESDEIGGSYFTHFLASGLSGSADADGDGRVTLSETYRYVYHETVFRTSTSRAGTQHPTEASDLSASGELVITELGRTGTGTLQLPASNPGRFAIFDVERRMFVSEVEVGASDRQVAVRPGKYLVQKRLPAHLSVAEVSVGARGVVRVEANQYRRGEYESDVAKGSIDATIRVAKRPKLSLHLTLAGRSFSDPVVQSAYFPSTGAIGMEGRFDWKSGQYVTGDFLVGSGSGALSIEGLDYPVTVGLDSATFGAGAGWRTPEFIVQAGGGLHLEAFWLRRRFPDAGVDDQELFSIAPGIAGWVGLHPGQFHVDLQLRVHYLPYVVDGRDLGMGFSELMLGVGYRF